MPNLYSIMALVYCLLWQIVCSGILFALAYFLLWPIVCSGILFAMVYCLPMSSPHVTMSIFFGVEKKSVYQKVVKSESVWCGYSSVFCKSMVNQYTIEPTDFKEVVAFSMKRILNLQYQNVTMILKENKDSKEYRGVGRIPKQYRS